MTTPITFRRQALRAAVKIHERLIVPSWTKCLDRLPRGEWENLRTTLWRLNQVESRGWRTAAMQLLQDVDYHSRLLSNQLEMFRAQLPRPVRTSAMSAPGQIAADLAALADEFEDAQIDLKERTITVRTEPIELEDLWLGSFDIRLWWERIGVRRTYEVIAKDPQRPTKDESVTHPHVRDNLLCEGDGALPIKAALVSGRVFDFFVLVRQTLGTYNGSSPYVAIEEWNGFRCPDCGCRLDADDASSCERCDDRVCSECSTWCRSCDQSFCSSCTGQCAECEDTFCDVCLTKDARTRRLLCKTCLEQGARNDDDDDQGHAAPAADALCLGETAAAA
jgi:hypothetical protein